MRKGIVKWFNQDKAYGFVRTEEQDVFLHVTNWLNPNRPPLKDELIEFELDEDKQGRLIAIEADRVIKQ